MAELLIRVRDKEAHPDPYVDAKRSKRGDVIAACPDGWKWSHAERTNPDWRIVRILGLPMNIAETFMSPERGDPRVDRMLRRREASFDFDHADLPARVREYLADDSRAQPSIVLSAIVGRKLRKQRARLVDPAVIG